MSYNRPSIIVTPSTPITSSKLFASQQEFSSSLSHLSPPSYLEEEPSSVRRIQRRVQLIAAILALFLSAAAFVSIVHPSFISVPIANGLEKHHGLFTAVRVNFDDHELRSNRKRGYPLPLKQKMSEPSTYTWSKREWKLAKMPAGSVTASESIVEEENVPIEELTTTTTIEETQTLPPPPGPPAQIVASFDSHRLKSTRVVQAQLMKEARARMDARKRRLGERMKGGK